MKPEVPDISYTVGRWGVARKAFSGMSSCYGLDQPFGCIAKANKRTITYFCIASAVNGVFSDGFQITGSPQTSARAAFQH